MANPVQHEDFGEKIGGAKKDLWKERGLLSGDLAAMNGREADKYVKKDNIWKKPDYGAMIDGGMPVDVAFFIIRKLTPTEFEILMGVPIGWTRYGHDGKPISESARYRALGNSIVVGCAEYVMAGTAAALREQKEV